MRNKHIIQDEFQTVNEVYKQIFRSCCKKEPKILLKGKYTVFLKIIFRSQSQDR
jgi:hypothetical protein